MKKIILLLILNLLLNHKLFTFDWPVEKRILTATFGESRMDHFHNGIDIGGGEQSIHPAEQGEVIYYYEEGENPLDLPTGLGSFIVLEHEKNLRTLYAHIKKGTVEKTRVNLKTNDTLGIIGDTGCSIGKHLHFSVIDKEFEQIVNPLLLLPPLKDTKAPVIKGVYLKKDGQLQELKNSISLKGGKAELLIETYDPGEYVRYFCPLSPYKINVFVNGEEIFYINYKALKQNNNKTILEKSGNKSFRDYYYTDWQVNLGSCVLPMGETRLEIVVQDFYGNETSSSFLLKING